MHTPPHDGRVRSTRNTSELNQLSTPTDQLPVKWDEELAKYATKAAALERPAVGRLAFRGGILTYQNQAIPGNKLNVVIVASAHENALFQNVLDNRQFDPSKPEAPVCYALSVSGEEMVPHPQSKTKMAAKCSECKYNAWGSAPNGGKGKACKDTRRLVMIPQSAVTGQTANAESVKKAEAATASIPVTSVKNWANYTSQLATEFRRPAWAMVTELSVHPHAKNQLEVKFTPAGMVEQAFLSDLMQRATNSEAIVLTPYSQESNAPPAQPQAGRKY